MVAATGRPRCENHPVSSLARPRAAALRPSRRRLLMAAPGLLLGAGGAAALSGCGTVRLGGPEKYTPPPPGIDDLYRTDLIALLDRAIAGTATVAEQESEDPARSADVSGADRKSTRLNSSHVAISSAVFCLKKKKNNPAMPNQ